MSATSAEQALCDFCWLMWHPTAITGDLQEPAQPETENLAHPSKNHPAEVRETVAQITQNKFTTRNPRGLWHSLNGINSHATDLQQNLQ